ncbi:MULTISPECIES: hypothetical protein [unclassified Actinopolyspora]|uniref:hypothetical protein n=1 Tax=unclassified Actinopolyspora TaxID=2639451 RepID=UPI0013F5F4E6|nr:MULTISPECIES: hypothetical protein [unclassified Actinopolyspora]NHD17214.1 hypothetical protein [Actinopolyspora sp. BKK2]NHE76366.1 hypothetical protein [Actinopolyspora sp. BKK1]
MSSRSRRIGAALLGSTLLGVLMAPTAGADDTRPETVTAGALPTPQTDGIVLSVEIVGNTVYAGGHFDRARPAGVPAGGAGEVPRDNLMAFDLRTGELLPWSPSVTATEFESGTDPGALCDSVGTDRWRCDTVFDVTAGPAGDRVYVGGDFDRIDDRWRSRVAAFSAADRALVDDFDPRVRGRVRALSATADRVYLGGAFDGVGESDRSRLAAVSPAGELLPWSPTADATVHSVLAVPQQHRVLVGGAFDRVNGQRRVALSAVDSTSGDNVAWQWQAPSTDDVVTDIATDGRGTAYFGSYNWEGFNPRFEGRGAVRIDDGSTVWMDGCYGDTQSVAVAAGVVYAASHTHACAALEAIPEDGSIDYQRLTAETTEATGRSPRDVNHVSAGDPVPELLPWLPNTNGGPQDSPWKNGPWAIDANSEYVVVGGEFTTVNGEPQQSLTRFAARSVPEAVDNGPQVPFRAPQVSRDRSTGDVSIEWRGTWDAQNSSIRYEVMRVGTPEPIHAVTRESWPWQIPTMRFTDTNPPAGDTEYWIRAVDSDGAAIGSPRGSTGW